MPRALEDPGKSQGPIQVPSGDPDGRDRRTGRECRPDPCLGWATRYVTYVVYVSYPLPERANILALHRGTFQYNNVLVQTVRREVRIEKASLQHTYQLLVCVLIRKTLQRLR